MDTDSIALEPEIRDYALLGGRCTVEGWLEPGAIAATLVIAEAQRRAGIEGPAVEIGVHHGLYFILLCLISDGGLAVDVFEDQHLNVDGSGKGDRAIFEHHLTRIYPKPDRIRIEQADSLRVDPGQLSEWLLGRPPRLFSIDGGHTARHAENDMILATSVCEDGAVIVVDDFENPGWPGVRVGIERFFQSTSADWQPLAIGGNKLYVAHSARKELYANAIEKSARSAGALRGEDDLFGRRVPRIDFSDPCDVLTPSERSGLASDPANAGTRFGTNERLPARLLAGWSSVETTGVWSQADVAQLALLMNGSGDLLVDFRVHAFCPNRSKPLQVRIAACDKDLDTWTFDTSDSCDRVLHIPAALNELGEWLTIEFHIDSPRSPKKFGFPDDDRLLGIGLEALGYSQG